jgi:hypothetical protein
MRPEVVVVVTPRFNGLTRLGQAEKDVLVEPFIPEPAVERFDEGVLDRFARFDLVPVERRAFAQRKNAQLVSSVAVVAGYDVGRTRSVDYSRPRHQRM